MHGSPFPFELCTHLVEHFASAHLLFIGGLEGGTADLQVAGFIINAVAVVSSLKGGIDGDGITGGGHHPQAGVVAVGTDADEDGFAEGGLDLELSVLQGGGGDGGIVVVAQDSEFQWGAVGKALKGSADGKVLRGGCHGGHQRENHRCYLFHLLFVFILFFVHRDTETRRFLVKG